MDSRRVLVGESISHPCMSRTHMGGTGDLGGIGSQQLHALGTMCSPASEGNWSVWVGCDRILEPLGRLPPDRSCPESEKEGIVFICLPSILQVCRQ